MEDRMNVVRTLLGVSLALAAVAPPARAAGEGAGTSSASFLSLGTGAQALGMGGAGVARWGSLELVGWNAASLGFIDGTRLAFSHAVIDEGTNQSWAALGGRLGALSTRWALSGQYQGEGSFEGRDASGLPTGSFDVASMAFGAHVAQPLGGIVTAGIGAKYVSERIGDVSGSGFAVDLGLQARLGPAALGVAAQNAFGEMRWDGAAFPTPENYAVGASLALGQVTLALDANLPQDYYRDLRMGAEWRAFGVLALRGGYRMELEAPEGETLDGPSFGIGGGWSGLWLDYGYSLEGHGDGQHRLAVNVHPGAFAPGAGLFGASQPEAARSPRPLAASKPVENEPAPAKTSARKPAESPPAPAKTAVPVTNVAREDAKDDEPAKAVAPARVAKAPAAAPASPPPPRIEDAEREGRRTTPTRELAREVETPPAKAAPVPVKLARTRPRAAAPLPEDTRVERPAPVAATPARVEASRTVASPSDAKTAAPKPKTTGETTPDAPQPKRAEPKSEAKAPARDDDTKAEATKAKPARDEVVEPGKAKRPKFTKMAGSAKKKKGRDFDDVAREAAELAEKKTGK
jgi:hypothetical protein